ncbi:peptidylprolyl isomerase [Nostoc spongiaeforme FACHB-130]|uniref:peptidylprolyl isomerase n=1 Tax=Nostoc spongiaeforme FACHB-130 TaxID=1357510 RepID=A0ABR8FTA6_9NOSO|nr:peptidylprolyl isomerase [Nostoc spongiaeforme]MBD2594557.1 peptidylprolyl isomerase [Nostoc spongiaeforme FACHB-130]
MSDLSKILLESEEVMQFLKKEMRLKEVYQQILFHKIIRQAAEARDITVTPSEIETEAEKQRRERHLERAADTLEWLADQLITPEDWERGICDRLLSHKLAQVLFADEVEHFFQQNRAEFEQVILYQMIIDSETLAQELYYQIEDGEISFYHAAKIYDIDIHRRRKCGYEGIVNRFALQPDIATVVFRAAPQHVTLPYKTEQGYHLFLVEELISAELTKERYQEIMNKMFLHWLNTELQYILNTK